MSYFRLSTRSAIAISVSVALLVLVVLTQFRGFAMEVIDHDEETFLLMAQSILRGELPYTVAFDNKPPGLFYLLAGAMQVFGQSLWTVRWFGDACIWLTGCLIFFTGRRFTDDLTSGLVAAVVIATYSSRDGLYTSAEVVAVLPLTAALAVLICFPDRYWSSFVAGVAISVAVLVRTNLALAAVGIGLFHLVALWNPDAVRLRRWSVFSFVGGGLLPLVPLLAVFGMHGDLHLLWVATVEVPLAYSHRQGADQNLAILTRQLLNFISIRSLPTSVVLVFAALAIIMRGGASFFRSSPPIPGGRDFWLVLIVVSATVMSTLVGGAFFGHYFTQFFAPLGLLLLTGTALQWAALRWIQRGAAAVAIVFALTAAIGPTFAALTHFAQLQQSFKGVRLAAAIDADRHQGDRVLAFTTPITLFYLNLPPLVALITHPSNLRKDETLAPMIKAGFADPDQDGLILRQKPRYIVENADGTSDHGIDGYLAERQAHYAQWTTIDDVAIWRRVD